MKEITNIILKEQVDFAFIYNAQMVNFTVVSHNLTFDLEFISKGDLSAYYPEYYSFFNDFTDRIPGIVFNAINHLLDSKDFETYKELREYENDFLWIKFLRYDNFEKINLDKEKKGNNLMFNIGEYLVFREYKKLNEKLQKKQEVKNKLIKL